MHIGENYFSMNEVNFNIPEIGLGAKLKYEGHITLRRSPLCPSVMGPFAYLPGMQCNHGVLSLWHSTYGEVNCEGERFVFDNADGYIEKDWGEAFPESWIWMQCGDANAALMCAVASIPLGRVAFTGLICVLWANGRQYRFATYNGGRVLGINQSDGVLTVELGRGGYRLCIIARNTQFGSLKAPTRQGMIREIQESVSATFDVSLCKGTHSLYTGRFKNGGLEMLNAPALLERKQKKSPR